MNSVIDASQAMVLVAAAHGLPSIIEDSDFPPDPVIAEYLRGALALQAAGKPSGEWVPVYITSVTNQVRRQLSPLWEGVGDKAKRPSQVEQESEGDKLPDPVRRLLEALEDLREVTHVGNGYWLPGPTRFVALPNSDRVLVVSGLTTATLRRLVHPHIRLSWVARLLPSDSLPQSILDDRSRWQSWDDWRGFPPADLGKWTSERLEESSVGMAPSAPDITSFEVYSPVLACSELQAFRWVDARQLSTPPKGLSLCRASDGGRFAIRRFWLGTIATHSGVICAEKECPVLPQDLRRLQYGLDQHLKRPTVVQFTRIGERVAITLRNPLPAEERRVLVAFGKEKSIRRGHFPLIFEVELAQSDLVRRVLLDLGVTVNEG